MTPEDVLLETIAAVKQYGDSEELRREQLGKLEKALRRCGAYYAIPFVPRADDQG